MQRPFNQFWSTRFATNIHTWQKINQTICLSAPKVLLKTCVGEVLYIKMLHIDINPCPTENFSKFSEMKLLLYSNINPYKMSRVRVKTLQRKSINK